MPSNNKKHGMSGSNIYSVWTELKLRCNNIKHKRYKDYGGRGITYDKEWEKFEGFYKDMGKDYIKGLTLDRENNNGNYNKKNCRWGTYKKQVRNRRNNLIYKGKLVIEICEKLGLNYSSICSRIYGKGRSIEKALNTKIRKWKKKN